MNTEMQLMTGEAFMLNYLTLCNSMTLQCHLRNFQLPDQQDIKLSLQMPFVDNFSWLKKPVKFGNFRKTLFELHQTFNYFH